MHSLHADRLLGRELISKVVHLLSPLLSWMRHGLLGLSPDYLHAVGHVY